MSSSRRKSFFTSTKLALSATKLKVISIFLVIDDDGGGDGDGALTLCKLFAFFRKFLASGGVRVPFT